MTDSTDLSKGMCGGSAGKPKVVQVMTFVEMHRFAGSRSEKFLLKVSMEGEFFGVGLFEAMARCIPIMPSS